MNNNTRTISLLSMAAVLLLSIQPQAFAGNFQQNHPRRAQVLHRTNNLNNRVNKNVGQLGGHYNQLKREDSSVAHQEQRDARQNGGHITTGEQKQLNREENHISRQIQRDHN